MSYAGSFGLQQAVFQRLSTDAALSGLVGGDIYDALPVGAVPSLYVSLGPERVKDASSGSAGGAEHEFVVSVVTDASGFAAAKSVATAVSDALVDAPLALARGTLVGLWFHKARAQRTGGGDTRRIDLTFRAQIDGL